MIDISFKYFALIDFKIRTENLCKIRKKWIKKSSKEYKNCKMSQKENHFNLKQL